MKRFILLACAMLGVAIPAVSFAQPATQPADAEAMLKEYRSIASPAFNATKRNDQDYVRKYVAEEQAASAKRAELAAEFARQFPDRPETPQMLAERWTQLAEAGKADQALKEIDQFLADHPASPQRTNVLYQRAMVHITASQLAQFSPASTYKDPGPADADIEAFIKAAPKDERGAGLLSMLASREKDPARKKTLQQRIIEQYPDSQVAKFVKGEMRQADGVGKPFELSFTDAISGKEISVQKDLKGKVVVVDFWATWCGPCVAEMPKNRQIYSQYKDKGVEFIGVSLDQPQAQGGLDRLKQYVKDNEIAWPQYYQGNGWNSDFSMSWGINSIPRVFIVDAEGKLYSVEARGKLETLIPELIAKRDKTAMAE